MPRTLAVVVAFSLAACGGGSPSNGDGGDGGGDSGPPCDTLCCAAERGTPDYSRASSGMTVTGATDDQNAALLETNHWRTSTGLTAIGLNADIDQASTAHANFMVGDPMSCWSGVHNEETGCAGFTGADPGSRLTAAHYDWQFVEEVVNWESTPTLAVDGWIWTVYHREPFLDWRMMATGYGGVMGTFEGRPSLFDVMDFGESSSGHPVAPTAPIVFPVPGQTAVPTSFAGNEEGPTPPAPASTGMWPSGTVVSVHFPSMTRTVTDAHIYYNGGGACAEATSTLVEMETDSTLMEFGSPDVFLYADHPLQGASEYVVEMSGTFGGAPWTRTWAFTTR